MAHHLLSIQYTLAMDRMALKRFPKRYVFLLVTLSSTCFYLSWCSFGWVVYYL